MLDALVIYWFPVEVFLSNFRPGLESTTVWRQHRVIWARSYAIWKCAKATLPGDRLFQGETDGSSFPNGGLRVTHSAAAFTTWDRSSPPFAAWNWQKREWYGYWILTVYYASSIQGTLVCGFRRMYLFWCCDVWRNASSWVGSWLLRESMQALKPNVW